MTSPRAFNWQGLYASSLGNSYCYAELTVSSLAVAEIGGQYPCNTSTIIKCRVSFTLTRRRQCWIFFVDTPVHINIYFFSLPWKYTLLDIFQLQSYTKLRCCKLIILILILVWFRNFSYRHRKFPVTLVYILFVRWHTNQSKLYIRT